MAEPGTATLQGAEQQESSYYHPPAAVELLKGCGAIRSIDEKLAVNPMMEKASKDLPQYFDGSGVSTIRGYRLRIEELLARIERWQHEETWAAHWRSRFKDHIISLYDHSYKLPYS